MFISKLVFTIVLAAGTAVNAFPNPAAKWSVEDINDNVLTGRGLPQLFKQHAKSAIAAFGPSKLKTLMHSGIGALEAVKVARKHQLQTVETTIFKAIMEDKKSGKNEYKNTLAKYCKPKDQFCGTEGGDIKDWKEAWDDISEAWAKYVEKSTTLATTKAGPARDSFYTRIEKPILEHNHIKIDVLVDDKASGQGTSAPRGGYTTQQRPSSSGSGRKFSK